MTTLAAKPAQSSSAKPVRSLNSLTGMRFIAAFAVFLSHDLFTVVPASMTWIPHGLQYVWGNFGGTGVSFFFVLSGFVLTWSVRPGDTPRAFWRRRACKIYPNHLVTALAAILLAMAVDKTVTSAEIIPNIFLVHAWIPNYDILSGVDGVSWSLCCEAFFYLCFPLLLWLISRLRVERLWLWAGAVVAAIWCVPLIAEHLMAGGQHYPFMPYSMNELWFVYFFPVTRCLEFVLGMILARLVIAGRRSPVGMAPATLLLIGCYIGARYASGLYGLVSITVIPLALIIVAGASIDISGRPSVLSGRVMIWLGNISFAFYLVHEQVIDYGARALGVAANSYGVGPHLTLWEMLGLTVLALLLSVVLSWLLYRIVERPFMHRWSRSRRPVAATPGRAVTEPDAAATSVNPGSMDDNPRSMDGLGDAPD